MGRVFTILATLLAATSVQAEVGGEARVQGASGLASMAALAPHAPRQIDPSQLLPPGIRTQDARASLSFTRSAGHDANGVFEIVDAPFDTTRWMEVEYTVDPQLDASVAGVLESEGVDLGHVILMDPGSGEVFSYVSTDPETFPATRPYPAASLMKVVTTAAMLRRNGDLSDRDCRYEGSPWALDAERLAPPDEGGQRHGVHDALAISNNQCFARYALEDVGQDALLEEIAAVGLLDAPGAVHEAGNVARVETALDLGELGSGLSGAFVTPLGAARLASLLFDGSLVEPYWVAAARDARGDALEMPDRASPQTVWPPEVTATLREMLVEVTTRGTAARAFRGADGAPLLGSVRVAGKTGTLSGTNPAGRYRWFVGVAPADAPRVAIAAVVVETERGGANASHVAAQTLRGIFCEGDACDAERVERLHARAAARHAARADTAKQRIAEAARDTPPQAIARPTLEIPAHLRRRAVSGEVVVNVRVAKDGRVTDARIETSELPAFDELVLANVRDWQFRPRLRRGHAVEAVARVPIPIRIR